MRPNPIDRTIFRTKIRNHSVRRGTLSKLTDQTQKIFFRNISVDVDVVKNDEIVVLIVGNH